MIQFTSDFCVPCQVMKPWVSAARREHARRVDVVVVNIDRQSNEQYARHLVVASVPTQVFVSPSGHVEKRHEGVMSADDIAVTLKALGWVQ